MVSVNKTTNQVTFGAGTTLHEANAILDEMGLALPVLGSISDQTVGGAISTGGCVNVCHGNDMVAMTTAFVVVLTSDIIAMFFYVVAREWCRCHGSGIIIAMVMQCM